MLKKAKYVFPCSKGCGNMVEHAQKRPFATCFDCKKLQLIERWKKQKSLRTYNVSVSA